ncbi:MAG TPA: S41 family peptidase [Usitatibacter sp.]|nr:S41 family peptidase [Usitatibacter sp.]
MSRRAGFPIVRWCLAPLFLLAGCQAIDPHNMIGRQMGEAMPLPTEFVPSPPPATLGAQARSQAFDFVWSTIDQHYYDPTLNGVDWKAVRDRYRPLALGAANDDEFWEVLDRMTGELKDAHTRVESPKNVALRMRDESVTMGFGFFPIGGRLVVTGVNTETDAWWAGVRSGMALVGIGAEPAMQAYERVKAGTRLDSTERSRHSRILRKILTGEPGTTASFTFERSDGTRFDATLRRSRITTRPAESHRILPSGYGYLRFTQWTLPVTAEVLESIEALKNAPGMVIDLRNNPGGSAHAVNLVLRRFFPNRAELGHVITRTGKPIALFFGVVDIIKMRTVVPGDKDAYKGPVVILVNSGSASASELFSSTMQAAGRATLVGQPTCGCLLGFLGYARIPGGAELAYSEVGFRLPNDKRIEGEGVIPDVLVPLEARDLQLNRDRALEEAQARLATMKPWDK